MQTTTTITKPRPTVQPPKSGECAEFDPSSNAKPCSPFYLYNHDSPRASTDNKPKHSLQVSMKDLEAGSDVLTPTVSQEKEEGNNAQGRQRLWPGSTLAKTCSAMTKPKQKNWLQRMTRKQRMTTKIVIALVVIGIMIGVAVGVAVSLKSGVNQANHQQGEIKGT